MQTENPKQHYTIGRDASFILTAKKLGLQKMLEKIALKKLLTATRREKRRLQARKQKRKKKTQQ